MSPSSTTADREAAKARVRAKLEARQQTTAREYLASLLHATNTHAEAEEILSRFERTVRAEVAADFQLAARHQDEFSWGEAVDIASNGLCSCRGGNKPCPRAVTR